MVVLGWILICGGIALAMAKTIVMIVTHGSVF